MKIVSPFENQSVDNNNEFPEYDRSKMPWDLRPIDRFIGLWSLQVSRRTFTDYQLCCTILCSFLIKFLSERTMPCFSDILWSSTRPSTAVSNRLRHQPDPEIRSPCRQYHVSRYAANCDTEPIPIPDTRTSIGTTSCVTTMDSCLSKTLLVGTLESTSPI